MLLRGFLPLTAQTTRFDSINCHRFYWSLYLFLKKDFIYILLEREEGREKERERNINVWLPLTCPHQGPGPQPRHVPWLEIKPMTLWFTGQHSTHWTTLARASFCIFGFLYFSCSVIWYCFQYCRELTLLSVALLNKVTSPLFAPWSHPCMTWTETMPFTWFKAWLWELHMH